MATRHLPERFTALAPQPLQRILVGASLDDGDENLLEAAGSIAQATGASLVVLHAAEPLDEQWALDTGLASTDDLRARLAARAERLIPAGVRFTTGIRPGVAHRVIAEVAETMSPDLILIGATAREGKLLGSTAERVVRKATAPVLVVRGRFAIPPRRVVAPVDLSDLSACGLHCGLAMASRLAAGREIDAVVLFAIGFLDPMSEEMRLRRWSTEEMTAKAHDRLDEYVAGHLPDARLATENRVVLGPARESILGAAQLADADLIVMSTHGHGGFERLILGSVAATIVREAQCSVLLVPPQAAFCDQIAEAVLSQTAPCKTASR